VTPDSVKTALRSRLGLKVATADQREVRESRPLCRNRLLTGYNAAEPDLAAETLFLESPGILLKVTSWITGDLAVKARRPYGLGSSFDFPQDLRTGPRMQSLAICDYC
jgi:hypothetical protein